MLRTRTLVIRAFVLLALARAAGAQPAPTVVISPVPKLQFFDNNGKPMAGGCVATYAAGTTTPLATYTDATGAVANPNPVVLDASGRAAIWIKAPAIKYVVKQKNGPTCSLSSGTILYTTDNVQDAGLRLRADLATPGANVPDQGLQLRTDLAAPGGAGLSGYSQTTTYPAGTVGARLERTINVADAPYNAKADGTGTAGTDQSAAFQAAVDDLHTRGGGALFIPWAPNCYAAASPITVYSGTTVYSDSGSTCVQKLFGNYSAAAVTPVFDAGVASGSSGVSGIWFRNFTVDGNGANVVGSAGDNYGQGINFTGCTGCGTQGMYVKNAYTGGISVVCYGSLPDPTGLGDNVEILDTIIDGSGRNNLEEICGTHTTMRGGALINAGNGAHTGGSLRLGFDLEPFAAGQLTTGFTLDSVVIANNVDGCGSVAPPYDPNMQAMLLNLQASTSTGTFCVNAINFNNWPMGVTSGTVSFIGGSYTGGAAAAIGVQGWALANIQSVTATGGSRGLFVCGSCGSPAGNILATISQSKLSGTLADLDAGSAVWVGNPGQFVNTGPTAAAAKNITRPVLSGYAPYMFADLSGKTDAGSATSGASAGAGSNPVVMATNALTLNSQIALTFDPALVRELQLNCGAVFAQPYVSKRAAGAAAGPLVGTVNTVNSGATGVVTWVSGTQFTTTAGPTTWAGSTITIAGAPFTIASVTDATHLVVTTNTGTQTAAAYSFEPNFTVSFSAVAGGDGACFDWSIQN